MSTLMQNQTSAAASAYKWEVVGGGSKRVPKKNASPEQRPSKYKAKDLADKMPKIETMQPIKLEPTVFDLIRDELPDDDHTPVVATNKTKKHTQQSPKLNKSQQQTKKSSVQSISNKNHNDLESVGQSLNIDEFKQEHAQFQARYPHAELISIRHMVSYLNLKLSVVPDTEPSFQEDLDYPSNKIDKKVVQFFENLISKTSKNDSEKFFDYLINEVITEQKLTTHHGYKIALQILINKQPELALKAPAKFNDLITMNNRNRQLKCLIYFWAIAQCGYVNLSLGLRVWFKGMIQFIHLRNFSHFIISYLNELMEHHKTQILSGKCASEQFVDVNEYFALYELINDKQPLLISKELQAKLQQSFNLIKTLFKSQSKSSISDSFDFILSCLPLETNMNVNCRQAEILDLLKLALNHGKDTYSKWREIYMKYLPQSKVLLNAIKNDWNSFRLYNFNDLKQTILYFDTNSSIYLQNNSKSTNACKPLTNGKSTKNTRNSQAIDNLQAELLDFNKIAKDLHKQRLRSSSIMGTLTRLVFYLCLLTSLFFYWDLNKNKSNYTNQVKVLLERYGLLEVTVGLIDATLKFAFKLQELAISYLPQVKKTSSKYTSLIWSNLSDYFNVAVNYLEPYGDQLTIYLNDTFKVAQEYAPTLMKNLTSLYYLFLNYTSTLVAFVAPYFTQALNILELNVLGWKKGELVAILSNGLFQMSEWIKKSALCV